MSCLGKSANNGVDSGLIEGTGYGVIGREGYGARADRLPATLFGSKESFATERWGHAGFAAGVGKLDSCTSSLRVDEVGDLGQFGDVLVFPDAEVGRGDAAFGQNGGGLNHDQSGATLGTCTEVNEVPVGGEPVLRRVLAHGRNADSIGESDRAKLKWRKKRWGHKYEFSNVKGALPD